jgi:hypothetical protein
MAISALGVLIVMLSKTHSGNGTQLGFAVCGLGAALGLVMATGALGPA